MAWVRWSKICMPKKDGGLGIKNLELFNLSLLGKWRWRLLMESENEWWKLLNRLYGVQGGAQGILRENQFSVWWKDIKRIEDDSSEATVRQSWFSNSVRLKLGAGNQVRFWHDVWCGPWPLKENFPRLFRVAAVQEASVADSGFWSDDKWDWKLEWNSYMDEEDLAELNMLEDVLRPIHPDRSREDCWKWTRDRFGIYSVKSAYGYLADSSGELVTDDRQRKVLGRIWSAAVPSKFQMLAWRLLRDGLPTRSELVQRGILLQNNSSCCVFCFAAEERIDHLFFTCGAAEQVWRQVSNWCGVVLQPFMDKWQHYLEFTVKCKHKKWRRMRHLWWIAVVWSIWIHRNSIVFRGGLLNVTKIVQHVKSLSWEWFNCKVDAKSKLTFETWCRGPISTLDFGVEM